MKILVVGNGGREHALLWKLRQDAPTAELYVTRGNGGTGVLATSLPLDPGDMPAIAAWCRTQGVDLVVVGPEGPLAEGLVDVLASYDVPAFGPTRSAARIESSKAYAKQLMRRAGVPTAEFATFSELRPAAAWIRERGAPIVVKASGLAAGKGALVCATVEEAVAAAQSMLEHQSFGAAGNEVVVEEFMAGEELSVFAVCDGEHAITLLAAQDHKRIGEGDTGPNTGGMGAYAPVSLGTPELLERVQREIFDPTLAAMRDDDSTFRGLLYAGLMLTTAGPRVVEFNARFGDPETQVVLPLLEASLLDALLAVARGQSVAGWTPRARSGAALTTVLAAGGYPGAVDKGAPIMVPAGVDAREDIIVFHAGTAPAANGSPVTSGGRVLAVTGLGATLAEAAAASRAGAAAIHFAGKQYRRDIGWREAARQAELASAAAPDA
jgi:phosphoribosylamine--glycine ligase